MPNRTLNIATAIYTLIICLFTLPSNALATGASPSNFLGQHTFDLTQEDWGKGEIFDLKGYWSFTWANFVSSEDDANTLAWTKVYVPGSWDQSYSKGPDDVPALPAKGYGTYYIQIKVPSDLKEVYLQLPDMASAYELWHAEKKLGGNGVISQTKAGEAADYLPQVYALSPVDGQLDLFIKTSNFHYQWGGLWYAPKITDHSGLFMLQDRPIMRAISGGTILLMSAIFCLLLYMSRPDTHKILYFGLFCLAIGIRRFCIDERVLYMTPYFDWKTLQAAENITMYVMLPLFLGYFREVFPDTTNKRLPLLGAIVALPFVLIVLLSEVEFYSTLNRPFQAAIFLFLPVVIYSWYKALLAKNLSAKTFGASLLIFLITIINDILNYNYIIETTNLMHMGALAFVLFQIAALMNRYLMNFKKIESLSQSLKEQNKELVQMDQFKDDFLASTSHELRMPLHGIAGLAKAVNQASGTLSTSSQNRLSLIESTASRLGNLVNDILDVASIKHGKLELQTAPLLLRPVVESALQSLNPLLKDKDIQLSANIPESANHIQADEQRLHQIFANLIGNAIKFTHHGSIHIQAEKLGDQVHISIRDTGVGIPASKLDGILQPFETANPTRHEIRGTGLGLSITNKLIQLHNGTLKIDSIEESGTTVTFTLPWTQSSPKHDSVEASTFEDTALTEESLQASSRSVTPSLAQSGLVFFADDEEVNRELVSGQLIAAGYDVEIFADGNSLLKRLQTKQPDLVLLDWMMPVKNGLKVCEEIRTKYDAHELPVMMLTARHQVDDIVQALNAGANDYLTKPYHEQELLARVYSQVSVRRLLIASKENSKLKEDIEHQQTVQAQLTQTNSRLNKALNDSHEAILLLNEDLDIVFANKQTESLFSLATHELIEAPLHQFVAAESFSSIEALRDGQSDQREISLKFNHHDDITQASMTRSLQGDDVYLSLIFSTPNSADDTQSLLASLTQELAENRQRMSDIESTLIRLNQEELADPEIETPPEDPNELVVKTLRTSLITWERYTHKTKAELAEQSRCWRVYLDGTTAKTRTLDKYLSVKTLPAKPRWRAVIKTTNYVLDHCDLNAADRAELEALIEAVNRAFN